MNLKQFQTNTVKMAGYLALLCVALVSCHSDPVTPQETPDVEEQTAEVSAIDTAAIAQKFIRALNLPDTASVSIKSAINGPEAEKHCLLAQCAAIRFEIRKWNQKIDKLQYSMGTMYYGPTIFDDVTDHAIASIAINNLVLKYDEILERLIMADFLPSGTFYEAEIGTTTFWLFDDPSGALKCEIRHV